MADQQNMNHEYRPPMHPANLPSSVAGAPPMMPPQFPGKQAPMGFPPQPYGPGGMAPPPPTNMQGTPTGPSGDLYNRTVPPPPGGGVPPPMPGSQGQRFPPAPLRPPGPPTSMVGPPPSSLNRGPPPQTFGGLPPPVSSAAMAPPPHPGQIHPPTTQGTGVVNPAAAMPLPPSSAGHRASGMVNGVNSSPQQPQPPSGIPPHPGVRPPGPPVANGPFNGPSPPGLPMSQTQGTPLSGQRPVGPGGLPQPVSSSFTSGPHPASLPPPGSVRGPPPPSRPTTLAGMSNTPPPSSSPAVTPGGLPVPYHGQAQYSHQLGVLQQNSAALTPTNSEPASKQSSRAPSPVPGTKYDALEGQFPTSLPGNQGPPFQGHVATSTGANFPPGPPGSIGGPLAGVSPPSTFPLPTSSVPSSMPPQYNQPVEFPYADMPSPPGVQQGMPPQPAMPPPVSGVPPPSPAGAPQVPGPPTSMGAGITGRRQYPQMPTQPGYSQGPPPPGVGGVNQSSMQPTYQAGLQSMGNSTMPSAPGMAQNHIPNNTPNQNTNLSSSFGRMGLQQQMEGRPLNLLQERSLIPPNGVPEQKPSLTHDFKKVNVNPEIFRCTLSTLPNTQSLLNKSRLPLGILIHPFKDLSQLPVIQSSVIVRCRACRTYINPFVSFVDMRRWKCNLCYRVNELPEEFNYDPVSKTYGEPQRRPEIRSSTIEFIAPSEYMLRPPQPAVYLFVLDVSFNAVSTGYLQIFCQTLLDELERIPGDARTQIGFITFDSAIHFYNLDEGLSQPQMHVVSDVEDIFLPCPDNLLVNLQESKELVIDLLNQLPSMFEKNMETGSALGAALHASYKMMSPTGGRVSVFQTLLPNVGPGGLKNREDPNERAGKNIQHLGPATDFYKKLSLECSGQQIAVDLFMLNSQYADMASVACIAKYSGGSLHYFPGLHVTNNPAEAERFEGTLRRYLTRKVGFEAVMRIRCTRGLSIHTFHGNFFVRSTDLLSLPNINPDAGFGMQMSIEDTLETNTCCFQAALLYTSSKGERRIRVHTMCLPVTNQLTDIYSGADQKAIIGLLGKMAVDRCIQSSMGDARDAMLNAAIDMLSAYGGTLPAAQRMGQLACAYQTRLMPVFILAMLKYRGFRIGSSTKLDDRVFALEQIKTLPLNYFLLELYPNLYPVHSLDDKNAINKNDITIPQPGLLHLSAANIDRHGAYLLDTGSRFFLWIGAAVSDLFCQEIFDVPNFSAIQDGQCDLPELDNETSDRLRTFIQYRQDQRPFPASFHVMSLNEMSLHLDREDSRSRALFLQYLVEDRTESTMSYYEFLQHLQKEAK